MNCIIFVFIVLVAELSSAEENARYVDVRPAEDASVPESVTSQPIRVRGDNTVLSNAKLYRDWDTRDKYSHENDNLDFVKPHYRINAFDKELVISLDKYDSHMAPAYTTTYSRSSNSSNVMSGRHGLADCFYTGTVAGVPESKVSVSICNGITGSIRADGFEYSIKPSGDNNQHTIHKRSISDSQSSQCGVKDKRHKRSYRSTFVQHVEKLRDQIRRKRAEKVAGSRQKRSFMSRQHYVETMIVADKTMADHHGSDLEHYILTVAMVANQVFSHSSLGNALSINIVKIMVVDNESTGPKVSTNAARTLHDFCTWQRQFNTPDDSDPNHYDLAVLLTRRNLCGDTCDTLGMAEVGAMCSDRHSCAVVEEDGLSSAYTLAHEVGHVLNMMHDDNALCRSNFAHMNTDSHIMSSTMNQIDSDQPWSDCSRKAITDFLESGRGVCLYDEPQKPKVYPSELPGTMYDVNAQCEMAFGPGSSECTFMEECGRLWCHTPSERNQCHTRHFPRADGSPCGRGLHCFQGKCTSNDEVRLPRDGEWGKWSDFGTCSRTCDGGVQMSSRECNNPKPMYGGKFCTGTRLRFRSCNTNSCPPKTRADGTKYKPDFREQQCANYNGHSFPNLGINRPSQWIPKYTNVHSDDKCKLLCQSVQTGSYVTVAEKVVDGTRCGPDTTDVCVQGHCMKAGCDGVLGSSATYDKCGVCKGGNRNCKHVKGKYNKKLQGYNDVIVIPKGAASIDILQRGYRNKMHDGNYLALKDSNGRYILNGGLTLTTIEKDFEFHGSIIRYTGVSRPNERIVASSPLNEPVTLQVLSLGIGTRSKLNPPRIHYNYYIPSSGRSGWKRQHVTVVNRNRENKVIKSRKSNRTKPRKTNVSSVGSEPLPPDAMHFKWVTGRWTKCKATFRCSGSKTRRVTCKDARGKLAPASSCKLLKPYAKLPCVVAECPASKRKATTKKTGRSPTLINKFVREKGVWDLGNWGACSTLCGVGKKVRSVTCRSSLGGARGKMLASTRCESKIKPPTQAICMLKECSN